MIYLSLLLFAPLLLISSAVESYYDVRGTWFNQRHDLVIEVKQTERALKVRGLFTRDWIKFRHIYGDTYECRKGSLVTIDYSGRLVYRRDRRARSIRFVRDDFRYYPETGGSCGGDIEDEYFPPAPPVVHEPHFGNDRRTRDYFRYKSPRGIRKEMAGRWRGENGRTYKIRTTRRGIKVKRPGKRWRYYEQGHYANEFISDRGTLVLTDYGNLEFYRNNGRMMRLYKR